MNEKIAGYCDHIIRAGIFVMAVSSGISITGIQLGFFPALFAWLVKIAATGKASIRKTPLDMPMLMFIITTLISCFAGVNLPDSSRGMIKTVGWMLIFFLVASNVKPEALRRTVLAMLVSGTAGAVYGLAKFFLKHELRLKGTPFPQLTSEIMLLMLGLTLAFLFLDSEKEAEPAAGKPLKIIARGGSVLIFSTVILTFVRGAWFGLLGLMLVFLLIARKPKVIAGIAGVLAVFFALVIFIPQNPVASRFKTIVQLDSGTGFQRLCMWKSGAAMVKDYPLGVGLNNVEKVYMKYRRLEMPEHRQNEAHLHNNFVQIAVERGIPGLLAFIWLWIVFFRSAWQVYRKNTGWAKVAVLGGILGLTGFHIAGIFEYDFGTSMVMMNVWMVAGMIFSARQNDEKTR